jgi:hypothetical protein
MAGNTVAASERIAKDRGGFAKMPFGEKSSIMVE